MLCTAKTTLKWGYLFKKNKRRGRKIINHHIVEGTRESHPRVHDLQHPRLGKPRRGLQIMDTRMGFPRPFHSVVIDSINLYLEIEISLFITYLDFLSIDYIESSRADIQSYQPAFISARGLL